MRTVQRTTLVRDVGALGAAMVAVGASFGAITIAYGLPTWLPFLMSTVVFAGGAQFLAVGLIAAGNPIAAVVAGLLLNARHLPFGLAVSSAVGPRWRDRVVGAHLMTDEVVAFTLAEADPVRRRRTYWLVGITLFTTWNTGTALGVLLGGIGDPNALGLDAAFPAGLIALIMPSLKDGPTRLAALTGATIAVLLTPVLPAGLPVMSALLGLLTLFRPRRRTARPECGPEVSTSDRVDLGPRVGPEVSTSVLDPGDRVDLEPPVGPEVSTPVLGPRHRADFGPPVGPEVSTPVLEARGPIRPEVHTAGLDRPDVESQPDSVREGESC